MDEEGVGEGGGEEEQRETDKFCTYGARRPSARASACRSARPRRPDAAPSDGSDSVISYALPLTLLLSILRLRLLAMWRARARAASTRSVSHVSSK